MNRCTTIAASLFLLAACSSGERAEPSPFTTAAPPVDMTTTGSTSTGSTAAEFTTGLDTTSTSSDETSTGIEWRHVNGEVSGHVHGDRFVRDRFGSWGEAAADIVEHIKGGEI